LVKALHGKSNLSKYHKWNYFQFLMYNFVSINLLKGKEQFKNSWFKPQSMSKNPSQVEIFQPYLLTVIDCKVSDKHIGSTCSQKNY